MKETEADKAFADEVSRQSSKMMKEKLKLPSIADLKIIMEYLRNTLNLDLMTVRDAAQVELITV